MKNDSTEKKDQYNFLLYVPEIQHKNFKVENDSVILYFTHDSAIEKFARWLVKKSNVSDLTLDPQGSAVWMLIDGKRNIYEIAKEMSKKFGDSEEVAIERLITFVTYMSKKGWIHFKEVKSQIHQEQVHKEMSGMDLNLKIDEMREDIIKTTQEIVKIRSLEGEAKPGMPFGEDVAKALQCALDSAEALGLKAVNVDGYVGYAEIGEGEEYVAALGHLDVVPEGDGWIYPPYSAEIHDGKIYGRGTIDNKGPIIACLYGLKAIKDANLPLTRKIRVLFGTNEETGSQELHHYLEKEKPPVAAFTPDANFPIINGEKGITVFNIVKDVNVKTQGEYVVEYVKGGVAANVVPDYAEALLITTNGKEVEAKVNAFAKENNYELTTEVDGNNVKIKSVGISAHGSTPEVGRNAIMQLVTFLNTLPLGENCISDAISFLSKYVGMEVHGESFGVFLEDEASKKLSFNLGKIAIDSEKIVVTLNLRYPVTKTLDDMMTPFNKTIENSGFRIENFGHQCPLYFSGDHPLVKTLQKVYTEQTGKEAELISIGGGTYAKEMPNTLAFGPVFPGDPDVIHKPNEYIVIEDLIQMTKIYTHALYELAK